METNQRPEALTSGLEPLLTSHDLAEYLGIPVSTVRDWRVDGKGPCGVWVGKHLRYAVSDVQAWLASQRESAPGRRPVGR
ncbi:helix-turn-helix transcriptional regulator [Promicromonospora sp. NPDC057488]|uniref:helix-turn-helix transcriptional regulator n=1 Tax=Promicromonospora sp. NPDC057488 TaxID=3346147 RepID=UPI0036703B0B